MDCNSPTSEPIDLPDVRSYLAMEDGDESQDALLTDAISFCRDRLESVLPYYLADREVTVKRSLCAWGLPPHVNVELRGPVLSVDGITLATREGMDVTVPGRAWFEFEGNLTIDIRAALDGIEPRPVPVGVTVRYHAGAHVPPVVKNALLMMVRNRYERRDEDPLTDAVMSSIYAETRPNI